ncbi:MAG TPA: class I SAM-dependent methyltransferase [Ktedonobacteraceae bacterium]|nr:class I SAM-dependent methyltransferase [Ktedonobacteraceae bacterium]
MNQEELAQWFDANKTLLETAYLAGQQPWQQSGVGLHTQRTAADWETLRRPIADCVDRSGSFLDIGCANGYLLECLLLWVNECGLIIDPYGLDLSEKLVELAKKRLPHFAHHLYVGNAWTWIPPQTFDYVRTELVYVPPELHQQFVSLLLERYLNPRGRLLIAEYRGRQQTAPTVTIDSYLTNMGFTVRHVKVGVLDGMEQTRIAVVEKD